MTYVYSNNENAFYPESMKESYESAGTWPDDGVLVTDDEFIEFSSTPSDGKVRGLSKGKLTWIDSPPPTNEQLIKEATDKKASILNQVNFNTQMMQTQLSLGIISDSDKAELTKWMKYAQDVKAISTDDPESIVWPEEPE